MDTICLLVQRIVVGKWLPQARDSHTQLCFAFKWGGHRVLSNGM